MIRLVSSAVLMSETEDDRAAGWAALNPASVCVCVFVLVECGALLFFTNSHVYEDAARVKFSKVSDSLTE